MLAELPSVSNINGTSAFRAKKRARRTTAVPRARPARPAITLPALYNAASP
jgi:hypothetical protein